MSLLTEMMARLVAVDPAMPPDAAAAELLAMLDAAPGGQVHVRSAAYRGLKQDFRQYRAANARKQVKRLTALVDVGAAFTESEESVLLALPMELPGFEGTRVTANATIEDVRRSEHILATRIAALSERRERVQRLSSALASAIETTGEVGLTVGVAVSRGLLELARFLRRAA
jgi:hypothetical protein